MGLMRRFATRAGVWQWRARYWWLDTQAGQRTALSAYVLSLAVTVFLWARLGWTAGEALRPGQPLQSAYQWVVQLIIAVVSAIISYALQPKPEPPKMQDAEAPTVEPGAPFVRVCGDCWLDKDQYRTVAHRVMGHDAIKKGGKK